jgi:hypothetical protein
MKDEDYNIVKFKFGKQPRNIKYYVQVGLLLNLSITLLSKVPGLNEQKVFNGIDVVQQKLNLDYLNDYIIKDEKYLNYRIDRVLTNAIKTAEKKWS